MAALATDGWLLVVLVVSAALPLVLGARGDLPEWLSVTGPFLSLRWSDDPAAVFDRLARPQRLWRALWTGGVVLALTAAALGLLAVVVAAAATVLEPAVGEVSAPQSVFLEPGINGFLPLAIVPAVVAALAVALFAHEVGHAAASHADGIDVTAVGATFLGLLPFGAYVEHDRDDLNAGSPLSRARMLAGGVTANFAVTVVAVALLAGPVVGSIGVASGVPVGGVVEDGPAADAGIQPGDVIERVDGLRVQSRADLDRALDDRDRVVTAQLGDGETAYVQRSLHVAAVNPGAPVGFDPNTEILAVGGDPVHTVAGFRAAVREDPTATVTTSNGTFTIPVGVRVSRAARTGALTAAGAPPDEPITILAVDGQRTLDPDALANVLENHDVGDTVPVRVFVDGDVQTYDVELRAGVDGNPRIGVFYRPGISGLVLSDFGIETYPAAEYLDAVGLHSGFGGDSVLDRVASFVLLPLAGVVGIAPSDFPGFTGHVTGFYEVSGPLSALGGGVFVLATVLFWVAWVNLNIGLFNCIPTLPLDGGRLVHAAADSVGSRWLPERDTLPETLTLAVTAVVLVSLAVTLALPLLS
ncbi:site-2 protease family protein [Halobacterium zhouii]|uniref:site-2 protease family protein n=1 Tax=Halobacterium zhouii TaxID=2902624 RepID=UPI001E4CC01F|nr:site-2 protease family protein [Halobacterium zhouii]